MKRTLFSGIAVSLLILSVVGCQQEAKQTDQQKQMQISEMMKDSSMVNMLMDHIASDYNWQSMMMQKMIQHAKSDRVAMTQIGKMMTDDMEMRSIMEKMTAGGMMKNDSMMTRDMMQRR
jgi:Na+-transporting NADH:ubiquinone oxidoreductase subunit NqrC